MPEEILVDRGTVDQFEILDRTLLIYNFVNLTTAGRAYMTCAILNFVWILGQVSRMYWVIIDPKRYSSGPMNSRSILYRKLNDHLSLRHHLESIGQ